MNPTNSVLIWLKGNHVPNEARMLHYKNSLLNHVRYANCFRTKILYCLKIFPNIICCTIYITLTFRYVQIILPIVLVGNTKRGVIQPFKLHVRYTSNQVSTRNATLLGNPHKSDVVLPHRHNFRSWSVIFLVKLPMPFLMWSACFVINLDLHCLLHTLTACALIVIRVSKFLYKVLLVFNSIAELFRHLSTHCNAQHLKLIESSQRCVHYVWNISLLELHLWIHPMKGCPRFFIINSYFTRKLRSTNSKLFRKLLIVPKLWSQRVETK